MLTQMQMHMQILMIRIIHLPFIIPLRAIDIIIKK
jgi:hypothetical protein